MKITNDIENILDIGYKLATERYYFRLIDLVMDSCMKFTGADGGELFIVDKGQLRSIISINKTLGIHLGQAELQNDELIDMKANNFISYTAAYKKIVRIDDIYQEKQFETLKLREFDSVHNYKTKSIMIVPIFEPGKKVIGVMQLNNCTDEFGNIVPFPEEYEKLVSSLTSQMAITLSNMLLILELEELLKSFVSCMVTAIDARTPYNANHTRSVAQYCMDVADYINALHTRGEFSQFITENDREQLYMAAMLHDLGKMITPREILNKATRLGNQYDALKNKLEKIVLMLKIDMLEGRLDSAEWAMEDLRLSNFLAELPGMNIRDHLTDSELYRINEMAKRTYTCQDGTVINYLDEDERKALNITKGTLTAEERLIVQDHVVYTDKMLNEIKFNEKYNRVQKIASNHHEYLDGSGYPNHLTADSLDILTRILSIADIFDSLTSNDRPYKGTIPLPRALEILDSMANEGKLDKEIVRIFSDMIKKREYGR